MTSGTPFLSRIRADLPEGLLGNLVQIMLDEDVPPIGLNGVERTRTITRARKPVLDRIERSLSELTTTELEQIWAELGQSVQFFYRDRGPGLAHAIIAWAVHPLYFDLPDTVFGPVDPNSRLFRAHPDLLEHVDKKGLVVMDRSWEVDPQILFYKQHALSYHQLLRRHFNSRINDQLLGTLIRSWRADLTSSLRVALDERRLLDGAAFRAWGEFDYWYGPPLTEQSLDDPNAIGVTRFLSIPRDDTSGLFDFSQLIVRWTYDRDANRKVCEIEELIADATRPPGRYQSLVMLRYLHAIRDLGIRRFTHVDGAVRGYRPETYERRAAEPSGLGPKVEPDAYRKLWRIDGAISTDDWSNMVARWYRHNELALEYLAQLTTGTGEPHAWVQIRADRVARGHQFATEKLVPQ